MSWTMKKRLLVYVGCFAIGAIIWRFNSSLRSSDEASIEEKKRSALFSSKNDVLVFVGDTAISQEDLEWEIDQYLRTLPVDLEEGSELTPESREQLRSSLREKLLENTIERKLLVKMIERDRAFSKIDSKRWEECEKEFQETTGTDFRSSELTKGEQRLHDYLCDKSLIARYFEEVVYSSIQISDAELKEFFEKNRQHYNQPERVQIRQILLASESEAKKVRGRVNTQNFAELAKTLSISPEAEKGGKLKPFAKGELPAVFDVAFSMHIGEIGPVQKSNYGFHIFMLEKRIPKLDATMDRVREFIVKDIREQKKRDEYKKQLDFAFNTVQVRRPRPLW